MKKTKQTLLFLLGLVLCLGLMGCAKKQSDDPWSGATYTEDQEFGTGEKEVQVEVIVGDHSITFTIHTNEDTVGSALAENELIYGDVGDYGLYVKIVNGITADYDLNKSYWAFYINDDYALNSVDMTEINENEKYQLIYTKE